MLLFPRQGNKTGQAKLAGGRVVSLHQLGNGCVTSEHVCLQMQAAVVFASG